MNPTFNEAFQGFSFSFSNDVGQFLIQVKGAIGAYVIQVNPWCRNLFLALATLELIRLGFLYVTSRGEDVAALPGRFIRWAIYTAFFAAFFVASPIRHLIAGLPYMLSEFALPDPGQWASSVTQTLHLIEASNQIILAKAAGGLATGVGMLPVLVMMGSAFIVFAGVLIIYFAAFWPVLEALFVPLYAPIFIAFAPNRFTTSITDHFLTYLIRLGVRLLVSFVLINLIHLVLNPQIAALNEEFASDSLVARVLVAATTDAEISTVVTGYFTRWIKLILFVLLTLVLVLAGQRSVSKLVPSGSLFHLKDIMNSW
ncbi:MAG: type IV secretion system protein [Rhodocyclaceae bacterium]|nr:type IV secretion system protein [Rhodocyclaceae bacterium]